MVSRRQLARDVWANVKFRLNGSTDAGTDELRQRILDSIAGQRVVDLARLGPDVLAGILPLLYREVLDEAYAHQDAGRPVYIVTAASQELAEVLAHVLVLDGGIGMRSEVRDGVYTGRPAGPFTYREGKAEAIRELAEREGIDLAESYAYSDSESDLPMMRAVGHPVAVNPDRELERVAREEGWRIMRFDKLGRRLKIGGRAWAAWRSWAGRRLRGRASAAPAARLLRRRWRPRRSADVRAAHAAVARPRGRRRRRSAPGRRRRGARAAGARTTSTAGARHVREHRARDRPPAAPRAPLERDRHRVVLRADPAGEAHPLPAPRRAVGQPQLIAAAHRHVDESGCRRCPTPRAVARVRRSA